ncbi:MAG: UDP-N-acetylmuramate--L-alanine ligase [Spirochaetia bacterium]|jgi:UDP-N-acetylmuramate--alanine ligase
MRRSSDKAHGSEPLRFPRSLAGFRVHLVGIKGTGMAALAEVLLARGARLTGSDTAEKFYTDAVLQRLSIGYREGFDAENLPPDTQLVIHSAAYRKEENPELLAAAQQGIATAIYPEALGMLSATSDSSGISGVHGKSTTTALCGAILKEWGFPATVIVGAEVPVFGGRSTLVQGDRYLVAETCELRRHFLYFHPARIVITSIEPDHLDYYRDLEDMLTAFTEYGTRLPRGGTVIYCRDDAGARDAAMRIQARRDDLVMIPYGREAEGEYRIVREELGKGRTDFTLAAGETCFSLKVPGDHTVLNAAAAIALCSQIWKQERGNDDVDMQGIARALSSFTGCRRRSEIVGEAGGILIMDDYAHHPTAIRKTLEGIRHFHPDRRLIVDFMSHTYSRTKALLPEFGQCFGFADRVLINKIYASAREKNEGGITGRDLYREVSLHHSRVTYIEEPMDAVPLLVSELKPGDLFLTMGAGDNWKIGQELFHQLGGSA